jgi:hypothetical protein
MDFVCHCEPKLREAIPAQGDLTGMKGIGEERADGSMEVWGEEQCSNALHALNYLHFMHLFYAFS